MTTYNTTENIENILATIFSDRRSSEYTDARIDMEHRYHVVQEVRQRAIAWSYNHYSSPLAPLDETTRHNIECVPSDVLAPLNRSGLTPDDLVFLTRKFEKLPRDGFILVPNYDVFYACKTLFPEGKVDMFLYGDSGCAIYEIDGEYEMDLPSTSWAVPLVSVGFGKKTMYIPAFTIELDEKEE